MCILYYDFSMYRTSLYVYIYIFIHTYIHIYTYDNPDEGRDKPKL